jgi:Tfp pilus assembly protein PilV
MSLIENLVALAVLSIALLGMAMLSNASLSATRANVDRQTAIRLTEELSQRLFAHLRGRGVGDTGQADCAAAGSICFSSATALAELEAWQNEVAAALPGGLGTLALTRTDGRSLLDIRVAWSPAVSTPGEQALQVAAPW